MNAIAQRTPIRTLRWSVASMLIAGGCIVLLCCSLWLDHHQETTLPLPSGAFAVGRTLLTWNVEGPQSTASRTERLHTLLAWIWYPAGSPEQPQSTAEYLPGLWRDAVENHAGFVLSRFLTRDLSRVRTHSISDAALSPRQPIYPVVLLRAGLAAQTAAYTTLAEDIASHGYIVVGVDAPYRTIVTVLQDGTVIQRASENDADRVSGSQQEQLATQLVQAWSADLSAALDQLKTLDASDPAGRFRGRLDMQRIGVVGHSLGGATALQFCHNDVRCTAGIDLDGAPLGNVVAEGVRQPFMFLLSDHKGESDAPEVEAKIDAIYNKLPKDQRLLLTIEGANHFGFSDDGALLKSPLVMKTLRATRVLRVDGRRQLAITRYYVDAFFDVYLKDLPAAQLRDGTKFPEVVLRH